MKWHSQKVKGGGEKLKHGGKNGYSGDRINTIRAKWVVKSAVLLLSEAFLSAHFFLFHLWKSLFRLGNAAEKRSKSISLNTVHVHLSSGHSDDTEDSIQAMNQQERIFKMFLRFWSSQEHPRLPMWSLKWPASRVHLLLCMILVAAACPIHLFFCSFILSSCHFHNSLGCFKAPLGLVLLLPFRFTLVPLMMVRSGSNALL